MQQLSLWGEPSQPRPLQVNDTFEYATRWANGDTSPTALARLAEVYKITKAYSFETPDGRHGWFAIKVIDTRVEGDHVVVTAQIVPKPYKSAIDYGCDGENEDV